VRTAFLVLLLANVALFVWWRYAGSEATADPAPLARQIDPEKLRVLLPKDLPPPAPAAPPQPPKAAAAPAQPPAPPPVALKCMEWGSFTLTDAPRAEKVLEPLALGARLGQRRTEETAGWWVFIPPQRAPNQRQAALRKASELRALGVEDYFIVQEEGQHRWALSLGVFRTEDAARARLAALRAQGVRTAIVGARETVVPKVWLQVKGVDPALETKLKELAVQIESTELRACPTT
jgi:sporulation related protein